MSFRISGPNDEHRWACLAACREANGGTERLLCLGAVALFVALVLSGCSSSSVPDSHSERAREAASKAKKRKPIYVETADAPAEIQAAIRRAAQGNKRVIVKFGGNWCSWCYRLHDMFQNNPVIAPIIRDGYELVLVDSQNNQDLMERLDPDYRDYGYPWLAVFDAKGTLLATQETEVLETGDRHDVEKVKAFLQKWQREAKPSEQ